MPKVELPKVDVKAKLSSMNESIRNARLPSPKEIKDNYKNSNFHKSYTQPLAVRTRVEEVDVQKQREFITQKKTPAQLSQMNHPLDFPMPKIKFSGIKKPRTSSAEDNKASPDSRPLKDALKARSQGTFPMAWTQQQLITSNKVMRDENEANLRRNLVKTKTPAQLAEFHSFSDFPVPTKVKNFLSPSERKIMAQKQKKASDEPGDPWTTKISNMFKGQSMPLKRTQSEMALDLSKAKGQKLITKIKVEADNEELNKRRALNAAKTPAELAQIHSLNEIPIPTTLKRMVNKGQPQIKLSRSMTALPNNEKDHENERPQSPMDTLKKSMNAQCLVRSKVENPDVQVARQEMVKKKTVAELSQITSLSDFPIPSKLQAIMERRPESPLQDVEISVDDHVTGNDRPTSASPTSLWSE